MTAASADSASLTLLQITDVHLRATLADGLLGVDTWHSVNAVLDQALAERQPDALLVTGDVAHDPQAEVYERFAGLLDRRYRGPTLVLPGNHDVLENLVRWLPGEPLALAGWTILGLDSHVDDEPQALVEAADIAALQAGCQVAGSDHVLVATHHPPIAIGCPWLDKDRIQNGAELLEWMAEHSPVRAMVFGHAHQEIEASYRQIALLGTPSTCIQFEPGSTRFSVDEQKPGYRWLELGAEGQVRSTVRRVADYPLTIDRSQFNKE